MYSKILFVFYVDYFFFLKNVKPITIINTPTIINNSPAFQNQIKKSIIYLSASKISSTGTCKPLTN